MFIFISFLFPPSPSKENVEMDWWWMLKFDSFTSHTAISTVCLKRNSNATFFSLEPLFCPKVGDTSVSPE